MLTMEYLEDRYRKAGYCIYYVKIRNAICAVNPTKVNGRGSMVILCDNWDNQLLTKENISYMKSLLEADKMLPNPEETDCLFLIINRWKERKLTVKNVILLDDGKHKIHKGIIQKSLRHEEIFAKKIIMENTMALSKFYYKYHLFEERHHVFVTYILILMNVFLYFMVNNPETYGISRNHLIESRNLEMLFTYMFMHAGLFHLMGNMASLFIIGTALERSIGGLKVVILYIISGLYGALFSILFTDMPIRITVGASGAIIGLMGALIIRTAFSLTDGNRTPLLLKSLALILISGLFTARVDNLCHIGGLIGGLLFGLIFQLCDKIEEQDRYIKLQKYFLKKENTY